MNLQKSLVYFNTSIRGNEVMIGKLQNIFYEQDYQNPELTEDVLIELKQAHNQVNIYSDILTGTWMPLLPSFKQCQYDHETHDQLIHHADDPDINCQLLWDECGYSHRSDSTCLCSDNLPVSTPFFTGILHFPENKNGSDMKYGVSRSTLLITAGVVWLVAGLNILRIGIICWLGDGQYWLFKVCEASLISCFLCLYFQSLYNKQYPENQSEKNGTNCPFPFRHF